MGNLCIEGLCYKESDIQREQSYIVTRKVSKSNKKSSDNHKKVQQNDYDEQKVSTKQQLKYFSSAEGIKSPKNPSSSTAISFKKQTQSESKSEVPQIQVQQVDKKNTKEEFQASEDFINYYVQKDPSLLLEIAQKAQYFQLYKDAQNIYKRILSIIDDLKYEYDPDNIQSLQHYVHQSLFNIGIICNQPSIIEFQHNQCMKIYQEMPQEATIQERITQLNSMSLFYRKNESIQKAINLSKQAYNLRSKYFTNFDERKFLALVNLACLYYENSQDIEGDQCTKKIIKQCPQQYKNVKELAEKNKEWYISKKAPI